MSKPAVNVNIDGMMIVAALVVVPLAIYAVYKFQANKEAIVNSVDPTSDENLAYRAANAGWGWVFGWDEGETVGTYAAGKVIDAKSNIGEFWNGLFN